MINAAKSILVITSATVVLVCSVGASRNFRNEEATQPIWAWTTASSQEEQTESKATLSANPQMAAWLEFQNLASSWKEKRHILSSVDAMVIIPEYQRIVGMGETALPMLIAQLKREGDDPDLWFPALHAITGINPVPAEDTGNLVKMARAWIDWANKEGYATA